TNIYTTLHGTFSSDTTVSGTYDKYSGAYFIYCGNIFSFGTGGTSLKDGTWQANKIAPSSGMALPVLLGYHIYRSPYPDARLMGVLIGTTDANTTTFTDANPGSGDNYYQVTAKYDLGESDPASEVLISGLFEQPVNPPLAYVLEQNYPNPFNNETEIRFQLPKSEQVVIKIFNTLGAQVRLLVNRNYQPGYHQVPWDGKDNLGNRVASGVYLYRLQAGEFVQTRRMSLLR
ncbi:T9SS type A sorting domain-containing protein, partial [candidate division KSB1 bacterium]|nr:T9SS type A sorting domain-containing protein [candidate division KSB1 bacterium]